MLRSLMLILLAPAAFAAPIPKDARTGTRLDGDYVWFGNDVVAETTYRFLPGGKISYSYRTTTHTAGSWTQTGRNVSWELNGKYIQYEGTVVGDTITVKAWNVRGAKWDPLTFAKRPLPKSESR